MDTIYLDTLFLTNFLTDYLLLLCCGRICRCRLNRSGYILAALLGAIYACVSVTDYFAWLRLPIMKMCSALFICLLAYWQAHNLFFCSAMFILISASFGGLLSALSFSYKNAIYLPINFKILLVTFALGYFILSVIYQKADLIRRNQIHSITVTLNNKYVRFTALHDTGNELYDPLSGCRVLVCQADTIAPLFPDYELRDCINDPFTFFCRINEHPRYIGKMRLIPYRTINGQGTLIAFSPDEVQIDDNPAEIVIAVTDIQFNKSNTYCAVF